MSARAKSRLDPRRIALRTTVLCTLVFVWVLLWGSLSAANIVSGLAIVLAVTLLLPLPTVPVEGKVHPLSLLQLLLMLAQDLVVSSLQVAWLAVKPGPPPLSAVLRAHMDVKSDLVLTMAVNIINLTPGTIALEVDQIDRIIYVHVIDVGAEGAVDRFNRKMANIQRLLVRSFERESDWRPAADKESA